MPVPGREVDQDLTVFQLLGSEEADHGGDQGRYSKQQMEAVDTGDEEEGVAALTGVVVHPLRGELIPGGELAGDEQHSKHDGCDEPRHCAACDGLAKAEPLVHDVHLAEHVSTGDLHGERAEEKDGGVQPEDGRKGSGEPLVDVAGVGVNMAAALRDEEDADDGDEEHEDCGEAEEEAESVAVQALAWAWAAAATFVPVVRVATAAGAFVGWRASSSAVVAVFELATTFFGARRRDWGRDDCRHCDSLCEASREDSLLRIFVLCPLRREALAGSAVEVVAGSTMHLKMLAGCGVQGAGRCPLEGRCRPGILKSAASAAEA